jgi:surface antigen
MRVLAALGLAIALLPPAAASAAGGGADGGNHFDAGYCTWQAAELAYEAWGTWPPWFGDAGDWAAAAEASGWVVSTTPTVSSIAAMPRGVQGSGGYGHVGWVIDVDADGAGVTLVSMNWRGRGIVSEHHIQVDGLVAFITPPATR